MVLISSGECPIRNRFEEQKSGENPLIQLVKKRGVQVTAASPDRIDTLSVPRYHPPHENTFPPTSPDRRPPDAYGFPSATGIRGSGGGGGGVLRAGTDATLGLRREWIRVQPGLFRPGGGRGLLRPPGTGTWPEFRVPGRRNPEHLQAHPKCAIR